MSPPSGLPARPTWYVGRAGVSAALDRGRWLTTIVAGTGSGKTTVLGEWAADRRAAWQALGADDTQLPVFLTGLAQAAREAGVPASILPGRWQDTLVSAGGADSEHDRADTLASLVAVAIDRAALPETIIVLDGFDLLPPTSPGVRFVEALSRHAPKGLRLVVSSRSALPFPVDRLRETGRLTELTGEDLAFDVDETYQLLTIALGDAAAADEIAGDLHTLTAGWPGQVSLGAAWLAQQPPGVRRAKLASFEGFDGHLAEAVLTNAAPETRELVRVAAYLPRVDARLLAAIGVSPDAAGGPSRLLARCAPMLMPESGRPGWYRISSATKVAVHARDSLTARPRRSLLRAAVTWFAENGELDSAIATAIELAEPDVLTSILDTYGSKLIASGRSADVISAVDAIPTSIRTPGVLLVEGEARHSRGDIAGALVCFKGVDGTNGYLSASVARRIGKIRQLAGDIGGAAAVYERVRLDGGYPIDEAILRGQLATVYWLRGDIDAARTVAASAMAMAEECGDSRALADAYATTAMIAERDGDFEANDAYARRAAAAAERGGDLVQLTRIRVNRSQRLVQQGGFADALVELDDALRLTELTGTAGWFGAVIRTNRGWAYRGLGRLDEAVAEADAAKELWRASGSDLIAYAQIALGAVYLDRGDLEAGEAELCAAQEIGERSGDHQALTGLSTLARARYATDPASAWDLAERSLVTSIGNWRHWALISMGWLALCDGDVASANDRAAEALANIQRFPDPSAHAEVTELRALAHEDRRVSIGLLTDAQREWARLGNPVFVNRIGVALAHRTGGSVRAAEARLRAVGVRPTIARVAGPLRVVGAFRDAGSDSRERFVVAARAAVARAAHDDPNRGRQGLIDALALLTGPPSADVPGLREQYLAVLGALAGACELAGDTDAALAWHLRLLEEDPFDEGSHLGVVSTLARVGRHAEARRRYRVYTERMRQGEREPAPYPADADSVR